MYCSNLRQIDLTPSSSTRVGFPSTFFFKRAQHGLLILTHGLSASVWNGWKLKTGPKLFAHCSGIYHFKDTVFTVLDANGMAMPNTQNKLSHFLGEFLRCNKSQQSFSSESDDSTQARRWEGELQWMIHRKMAEWLLICCKYITSFWMVPFWKKGMDIIILHDHQPNTHTFSFS